ncbi:family 1 glycosylhydrolase [Paenibacillus terrigena]|uniref:family 1 glycosylhydrolase n=1 Tax=Paenibacillus terrigena TaxID=369333 RepID=UPI0012EC702F|nr:family 1 glycosylhydrolase [Paenibacillus terrigena]
MKNTIFNEISILCWRSTSGLRLFHFYRIFSCSNQGKKIQIFFWGGAVTANQLEGAYLEGGKGLRDADLYRFRDDIKKKRQRSQYNRY